MNNWSYQKLSTLCSRIGDGLHGTPKYLDDSDIYFINGNNLNDGKIEINHDTKKVSSNELKNNFISLNENSLLLSINGTIGSMAFYKNEKVMLGKSAAYLNFNSGINKFYYYYFQLDRIQKHFYNIATGSTIKNLSLKSIQDFEVPVPDDIEWKKIASALSTLDAKIQLNNKINAELEKMAKAIYDYWFVQFDFPDKDGKPYKSSGGKMVWNEELKQDIPEGWEVKTIGSFSEIKRGTLVTEKTANTDGSIKVVSAGIDHSYMHSISNRDKNTITISGSGANAGFINFWREPIFACDCTTIRGVSDSMTLVLLGFLNIRQEYIMGQARGSAQPHVYPKDVSGLKMALPPSDLITKYGNFIIPGNDKISSNLNENQELKKLRDWLLPMLMNRQVKVL